MTAEELETYLASDLFAQRRRKCADWLDVCDGSDISSETLAGILGLDVCDVDFMLQQTAKRMAENIEIIDMRNSGISLEQFLRKH